ncbi:hypothetical protein NDU88_003956 [Pleurodeles waltl]|uniref:Uncharacterized protein n=1 Tax=Pleurodeles waltl TaxID=8319 RepID=A0AAV7W6V6_PLEWA|nr:hypothetical protein NDU88_003956 [Pleurodeles waltl]
MQPHSRGAHHDIPAVPAGISRDCRCEALARQPVTSRASAGYKLRVSRLRVARLLPRVLTHRVREENAD